MEKHFKSFGGERPVTCGFNKVPNTVYYRKIFYVAPQAMQGLLEKCLYGNIPQTRQEVFHPFGIMCKGNDKGPAILSIDRKGYVFETTEGPNNMATTVAAYEDLTMMETEEPLSRPEYYEDGALALACQDFKNCLQKACESFPCYEDRLSKSPLYCFHSHAAKYVLHSLDIDPSTPGARNRLRKAVSALEGAFLKCYEESQEEFRLVVASQSTLEQLLPFVPFTMPAYTDTAIMCIGLIIGQTSVPSVLYKTFKNKYVVWDLQENMLIEASDSFKGIVFGSKPNILNYPRPEVNLRLGADVLQILTVALKVIALQLAGPIMSNGGYIQHRVYSEFSSIDCFLKDGEDDDVCSAKCEYYNTDACAPKERSRSRSPHRN